MTARSTETTPIAASPAAATNRPKHFLATTKFFDAVILILPTRGSGECDRHAVQESVAATL